MFIVYTLAAIACIILGVRAVNLFVTIHRDVMAQMKQAEEHRRVGEWVMKQQTIESLMHRRERESVKTSLTISENCWRVRRIVRKHNSLINVTRLWNWADHQEHSECYWRILTQECPHAFVNVNDPNTIKMRYAK